MTESRRTKVIDELIDTGSRYIHKTTTERFYNCEVCWTCKFFDVLTNECFVSNKDAGNSLYGSVMRLDYYDEKAFIKKPTWFRCLVWRER